MFSREDIITLRLAFLFFVMPVVAIYAMFALN